MQSCKLMDFWRGFLDSLDSGGGQAFLLMCLIVLGVIVYKYIDPTAGGQVMTLSFGAYLAKIRDKGSNRDQMGSTTTVAATTTHTDPPATHPVPPAASEPVPA